MDEPIENSAIGETGDPVEIPHRALSADVLRSVVESFVLREGTDYGAREYTLEEKIAHVIAQLERGEAQIMFEPESESVAIVRVQNVKSQNMKTSHGDGG